MASSHFALYNYFCVSQNKSVLNWTQVSVTPLKARKTIRHGAKYFNRLEPKGYYDDVFNSKFGYIASLHSKSHAHKQPTSRVGNLC